MTQTRNYLALDLGASGGRAIIGRFDGERLALEEVHRFVNGPVHIPSARGDSLHWDTLRLFAEIQEGLKKAVACCGSELISLGIDTWGVDYGLLDRNDRLVGLPYHYRDSRNDTMMAEAFRRVPREEIFAATGIQFMQLNTLFQLLAQQVEDPEVLARTRTLLMMPDLLNFWLTGQKVSERTIASTSQALDPHRPAWATGLLERLGIPTHYLPTIVEAGTVLGGLLPAVIDETGAKQVRVVAPGSHDTASAVAAVPAESADYAYLSSGTWSLMGVETKQPVINADALAFNVTNEGGVCDTIRLLKNIAGLWIIQECRRTWAAEGQALSWDDIVRHAAAAQPFVAQIDVDAHDFLAPGDMPARIREYCRRTGQTVPEGRRPHRPRRLREPGAEVSPRAGDDGGTGRHTNRRAAHRGRRRAEPAAQPTHCRCHRPAGRRRTVRGHRGRQSADATARHRRGRLAGRGPCARPPLIRHGNLFAGRCGRVG